ncbi:fimbria biosynthesis transcriptional regulator FimW [Enterobacteriaceae bacterium H18W14]|uniref:fimbria biosynthesis transcriptional regulator FimW n=1 Tax=Dryocola boscaweniae TaxID=2925397 RepID=UPI0022F03EF6|nr:fimbria biosynthesis transcriptional regulator FimW [Dryocola boscaweniae]MCT4714802.1 fimbria biosynthesis transcriptional regulator FimW [Dryocola boscaweniae]
MLTVAIREKNSHFVHGIKIIVQQICKRRHETFHFLPAEHHDVADVLFISLEDNWISADCYKMPQTTQTQRVILICRKEEHEKLMFRPCLYMLPAIFREDEVEEITHKIAHWTAPARRGNNTRAVPASVCKYCTTRHFSLPERELLRHIACGHSLCDAAYLMKIDESAARLYRQAIMKKLRISSQQGLIKFIRVNLLFLLD